MSLLSPEGRSSEFQPIIKYKETEKSPLIVAKQTYMLLELFHQQVISKPELAKDYFCDYTLSYLDQARKGASTLYEAKGAVYKDLNLETREMAHHAFIVFANLPDHMTFHFLQNGFSRRGMLRAPGTRDEFVHKINEIKMGIWQTVEGRVEPETTLEANPHLLRTYGFFKVASELLVKMPESEKRMKQEFNELLKDIDISL
jgi:hypothetical protein